MYSGTGIFRGTNRAGFVWEVYPDLTPPSHPLGIVAVKAKLTPARALLDPVISHQTYTSCYSVGGMIPAQATFTYLKEQFTLFLRVTATVSHCHMTSPRKKLPCIACIQILTDGRYWDKIQRMFFGLPGGTGLRTTPTVPQRPIRQSNAPGWLGVSAVSLLPASLRETTVLCQGGDCPSDPPQQGPPQRRGVEQSTEYQSFKAD